MSFSVTSSFLRLHTGAALLFATLLQACHNRHDEVLLTRDEYIPHLSAGGGANPWYAIITGNPIESTAGGSAIALAHLAFRCNPEVSCLLTGTRSTTSNDQCVLTVVFSFDRGDITVRVDGRAKTISVYSQEYQLSRGNFFRIVIGEQGLVAVEQVERVSLSTPGFEDLSSLFQDKMR